MKNQFYAVFERRFGDLRVMYAFHIYRVGKRVIDFLKKILQWGNYNLRKRPHSLQLPDHNTHLADKNFITHMLYKNAY